MYVYTALYGLPQQTFPPGNLKADFYISQDAPGDKFLNEGVLTIFNEVDQIRNALNAVMMPNGSQASPARSCYDLFLCNPTFEEGEIITSLKLYLLLKHIPS